MRPAARRCCTSPTCRSSMLGFRTDVTTRPIPAYTWDIMSKLPFVVGGLAVVLTGASVVTRRRNGHHDDTPPWERTSRRPEADRSKPDTARRPQPATCSDARSASCYKTSSCWPRCSSCASACRCCWWSASATRLLQRYYGRQARLLAQVRHGRSAWCCALWALAAIALILRFTGGLGAVTNLSDQFPLGLWIGFDVMAGAMLGGGAFVLAGLVYVFGLEHYRPDPALDDPDRLPGLLAADRGPADRRRPAAEHLLARPVYLHRTSTRCCGKWPSA